MNEPLDQPDSARPPPRRVSPRFTIAALLWVTTLLGMAAGLIRLGSVTAAENSLSETQQTFCLFTGVALLAGTLGGTVGGLCAGRIWAALGACLALIMLMLLPVFGLCASLAMIICLTLLWIGVMHQQQVNR